MITKSEMIEELRMGKVYLPPLNFRFLEDQPAMAGNRRFDALLEASWRETMARFAIECKPLSTPKAFQDGLNLLKIIELPKGVLPMLLTPFLGQDHLRELEREGISGIDLCGNGVVMAPGLFSVFRSGVKNRFPSSAPIKNIYRKNSSMVGRVFLVRPVYGAVGEICAEINRRNPLVNRRDKKPMGLSTVSKALKTLEEDLIVGRNNSIRLLQPDKLMEKLGQNYCPPKIKRRVRLKLSEKNGSIRASLLRRSRELALSLVATGISSAGRYAVTKRGDVMSIYCHRIESLLECLSGSRTDRFPTLELIETEDETVYFDSREDDNFLWASPAQAYLELIAGDKRDRETAEQVKSFILAELQKGK